MFDLVRRYLGGGSSTGAPADGITLVRAQKRGLQPMLNRQTPNSLFLFYETGKRSEGTMETHSLQKGAPATVSVTEETMDTARAIMKLLHEVENLKRLRRSGWEIKNIPNPESVAEHSFRLAIMTFFAPVRQSAVIFICL